MILPIICLQIFSYTNLSLFYQPLTIQNHSHILVCFRKSSGAPDSHKYRAVCCALLMFILSFSSYIHIMIKQLLGSLALYWSLYFTLSFSWSYIYTPSLSGAPPSGLTAILPPQVYHKCSTVKGKKNGNLRRREGRERSHKKKERDVNLSLSKSHTVRLVGVKTIFQMNLKGLSPCQRQGEELMKCKVVHKRVWLQRISSHRWGSGNRWSRIITSRFYALNYSSHPSLFRLMQYTVSSNSQRASAWCTNHHLMINKLCSDKKFGQYVKGALSFDQQNLMFISGSKWIAKKFLSSNSYLVHANGNYVRS